MYYGKTQYNFNITLCEVVNLKVTYIFCKGIHVDVIFESIY